MSSTCCTFFPRNKDLVCAIAYPSLLRIGGMPSRPSTWVQGEGKKATNRAALSPAQPHPTTTSITTTSTTTTSTTTTATTDTPQFHNGDCRLGSGSGDAAECVAVLWWPPAPYSQGGIPMTVQLLRVVCRSVWACLSTFPGWRKRRETDHIGGGGGHLRYPQVGRRWESRRVSKQPPSQIGLAR